MNIARSAFLLLFLTVTAMAQMPPLGELQVKFTPASKLINPGDSIWFEAGRFAMDLRTWSAEYTIRKISQSQPDSFLVMVQSHVTSENGPAIAGYDGPQFYITTKDPGVYVVRFDSTSEFQADMADSAAFRAEPSSGIRSSSLRMGKREAGKKYRLNGGRVQRPESTPAYIH
jgi:hypothetical protein